MSRGALAIVVWLALVSLAVIIIARTRFDAGMNAFLPRAPTAAQSLLVSQLRDGVVSRVVLMRLHGEPSVKLGELSQELAARLRQTSLFALVNNGSDQALARERALMLQHRYVLSSAVTPQRFSAAGLHSALERGVELLSSPLGLLVEQLLPRDASGEMLHILEQFQGANQPANEMGVWFTRDGCCALLIAQTRAPGFDIDAQERVVLAIRGEFQALADKLKVRGARLELSGPGVFSVDIRARIKNDAAKFSLLASAMVAALLVAVYRSPRLLLLAFAPVVSGALVGVAAVSLGFGSVHGITLGFGTTLIGEAVDYAIYLFNARNGEAPVGAGNESPIRADNEAPITGLDSLWRILRLGVLTSICGFGTLMFAGFPGLQQLGLFSVAGLITAFATTRYVLPRLISSGAPPGGALRFEMGVARAMTIAARQKYLLAALVAASVAVLIAYGGRSDGLWSRELSSLSPLPLREQRLDEALRRELGAPDVRQIIVIRGGTEQQVLQRSEAVSAGLQRLLDVDALGGFDAPSRWLPSERAQQARRAALPDTATLRTRLNTALDGLPLRAASFEPFIADVAAARSAPLLTRAAFEGTGLGASLDALLIRNEQGWLAMLPLRDVRDAAALSKALPSGESGVLLLDLKRESDALYRSYSKQAVALSLAGAAAMIALLLVVLRSPRRVYAVIAPLAAAIVVTTAVLAVGGEPLTIFHLIGLMLVIGVGSNYSLFFERDQFSGDRRHRTLPAVVICNLCAVIGFGVLAFSSTSVLRALGITVALGAFLSLIFSMILIGRAREGIR